MSVLKNLRMLARYQVLTPVAVLGALAAAPQMALGAEVGAGQSSGTVTLANNENLTNSGTITQTATFAAVNASTNVGTILNNSGGIIRSTGSNFAVAVRVLGNLSALVNNGSIRGNADATYAPVYLEGNVGSIINNFGATIRGVGALEGAIAIKGTTGSFYNAGGLYGGSGGGIVVTADLLVGTFTNDSTGIINGANAVLLGGGVTTFANAGSIVSTDLYAVDTNQGDVGTFTNAAGGSLVGTTGVRILGDVGSFTNAGTIRGTNSLGVLLGDAIPTFINTGTIAGGGIAAAVQFDGSGGVGNFINSGTLRGGGATALQFGTGADKLTIQTGSEIYGTTAFGNGADSLDFSGFYGTTVLATSGLETLVAGDRAFAATAGNATVTIFDQTGAASLSSVTTGVVGSIQTAIANELGGFSSGNVLDDSAISGYAAQPRQTSAEAAASDAVLSELDVANPSAGRFWGTVFGGVSGDTAPVALSNVYGGLVAGTHFQLDAQTRLGGLVGYSMSKFNVANGQQVIDSQTGVLGVYGKTDLGMIELSYALLGGGSGHTSSRQVVVGAAKQNAAASFASWFINPSLGISVPVMSDDTTTIKVAASGSYIYGGVGGYTETAPGFTAAVGAMPISVFEARFELNGEKVIGQTSNGDIRLRGKVGVMAQANMGSSNIPLTLNGTATTFANPGTTTYGAYAGAGLSADIGHGLVLDAGLDFTVRADGYNSGAGKVSLVGSF